MSACPCYLHRHSPMAFRDAGPCICECDVPHEEGNNVVQAAPEHHLAVIA